MGMSHIPEDRHKHGLVLDYTLEDNMVLQRYFEPQFVSGAGFLRRKAIRDYATRLIEQYDVRSGQGPVTPARSTVSYTHLDVYKRQLLNKPPSGLCVRPLPHNFIKRAIYSPFDEIETLLQCVFPLERRIAPAEGARFSGSFAKKPCT